MKRRATQLPVVIRLVCIAITWSNAIVSYSNSTIQTPLKPASSARAASPPISAGPSPTVPSKPSAGALCTHGIVIPRAARDESQLSSSTLRLSLSTRGHIGGFVDWASVAESEPHAGVRAQRVDTAGMTLVRYVFQPGAAYPRHQHPEEQLVHVLSGTLQLELGGETLALAAGDLVHVAGGVPHGARGGATGAVFLNLVVPRRP